MKSSFLLAGSMLVMLATPLPAATAAARFAPVEQVMLQDSLTETGLLSISRFDWHGRIEDALDDIERQWRAGSVPSVMRSSHEGWQQITRLDGDVVESIQLRKASQGLEGRRIRWTPSTSAAGTLAAEQDWARELLPRQASLMPPLAHVDGGARMTSFVAWMDDSVVNPAGWVMRKLAARGYAPVAGPVTLNGGGQSSLHAKGHEEVHLTTRRQGTRQFIVLHWKH